jgi:hypothetical protein
VYGIRFAAHGQYGCAIHLSPQKAQQSSGRTSLGRYTAFTMKKIVIALIIAVLAGTGWGLAYFIFG